MIATHETRDLLAPDANGSEAEGPVLVPEQTKFAAACVTGPSAQWGTVGAASL